MAALDEYLDNTMEADDIFPCKGCGEILEEGKAFELGRSTRLSWLFI
jgi:Rho-type GTPase-activating protein 1/2